MNSDQTFPKWLFRTLVIALGISPPAITLWFQNTLAKNLEGIKLIHIVQAGAALFLVATTSIAYILYLRPWLRWDEPTGTWISRFTNIRYCGTCRAKKIISPLKNEITGWRCVVCTTFRTDPARKQKNHPKQHSDNPDDCYPEATSDH